ncbi:unnamed protein product [Rhizoctonia solani]|uniref:F-box domain-containing protein n=1 Tax=Rhizoctonia solani TaxID=456999 RepID=A0A8H3GD39_9AGAM|nr:unnamed protein product [Rhizoctonia solani]
MPLEVFNEIVIHLLPIDLLSLTRSNKFFRKILMFRTSQPLWKAALENIPHLPPCPVHLSEPQYSALLFSKTCSNCGTRVLRRMDPYLHVRLCNTCRDANIMDMELSSKLLQFLPRSDWPPKVIKHTPDGRVYVLKDDFYNLNAPIGLPEPEFIQWQKDMVADIYQRQLHSGELELFLDMSDKEREMEIETLKIQRLYQIEGRLFEAGWARRDTLCSQDKSSEWQRLVEQPKPLTDRIWKNLYPKLVPLLQLNRARNERADMEKRRRERIEKLQGLVSNVRKSLPLLTHVTPKPSLDDSGPAAASTSVAPALDETLVESDYEEFKVELPFPSTAEIITWPTIKDIIDNETSLEDVETQFGTIKDDFDRKVVEWRDKIEQDLLEIWNDHQKDEDGTQPSTGKGKRTVASRPTTISARRSKGRDTTTADNPETHPIELNLPKFITTFTLPDGSTTAYLSDLSESLQLLLRADTMFKGIVFNRTYPAIVPPASPLAMIIGGPESLMHGERWDPSKVKRDDEASAVAKELLARVGRSGATSVEMKALGGNFRCGRCERILPERWEDLAQEKIKAEPKRGFIFNNTHDLDPGNPKPFAHFMTPQAASEYMIEQSAHDMIMMACMKCEEIGIQARYLFALGLAESPIMEHLCNVHDVVQGVPGLHFRQWEHDVQFFDPFNSDSEE